MDDRYCLTRRGARLVEKLLAFYRIQIFMTVFTNTHQWSLSCIRWIQFILSHPISLRSILILFSHLRPGYEKVSFLSDFFPLKFGMCLSFHHACCMLSQPYHAWLYHFSNTRWRVKSMDFLIMLFFSCPCYLMPRKVQSFSSARCSQTFSFMLPAKRQDKTLHL
jgi:hypothetical protein